MCGLWESAAFIVPIGVQQNPSHFLLGGIQERVLHFGAEVVSLPLYRYFWAAGTGAVDFHPLWLPDSTCGSSYNFFFSSLNFWGLAVTL